MKNQQPNYRVVDASDKAILRMPSGAVHLWLAYKMHENELTEESWPSLTTLEDITGMDRKTIIKWQRYLKDAGRLVETGETAADKYGQKATQGSRSTPVVRLGGGNIPPAENPIELPSQGGGEFLGGKIPPKVSCYGSGSDGFSSSRSQSRSDDSSSSTSSKAGHAGKGEPPEGKPKPPNQKPKTSSQSLAPDGTTWQEWDAHDQVWKTRKLIQLGITKPGDRASARNRKHESEGLDDLLDSAGEARIGDLDDPEPCCVINDDGCLCLHPSVQSHTAPVSMHNAKRTRTSHYCQEHLDEYRAKGWLRGAAD